MEVVLFMEKTGGRARMVAAGALAYLFLGVMYAWSVIRIQLVNVFPDYTASRMSLAFTLMMSFFCIGGFCGGRLVEKKTPALSLRICAVLVLAGYLGASFMEYFSAGPALAILYLSFSCVAGFGTGMGYNACMTNIAPWFPGHVGLVTGILLMGFGVSSLIFGTAIERLSPSLGIFWIFRILGVSIFLVVLAASFFVKKPPEAARPAHSEGKTGCTPRQMVSSASFWVYFIWNAVCGAAGLLVINNAGNIAQYFGLTASLGLIISVFNGCGRPVVGAMTDRLGRYKSMFVMIALLIFAALLLILADVTGTYGLMFPGLILVGIIYGGGSTISSKITCEMYGTRHYSTNHSIMNFCIILSSFIGPLLSGVLQDRSDGGFSSTFVMLLVMGFLELILIFVLMAVAARENKKRD